jgi:hypothetical protein
MVHFQHYLLLDPAILLSVHALCNLVLPSVLYYKMLLQ